MCLFIANTFNHYPNHIHYLRQGHVGAAGKEGKQGMKGDKVKNIMWSSDYKLQFSFIIFLYRLFLSVLLLPREPQELWVQLERQGQWDPRAIREGPVQKAFEAFQVLRLVWMDRRSKKYFCTISISPCSHSPPCYRLKGRTRFKWTTRTDWTTWTNSKRNEHVIKWDRRFFHCDDHC